MIVEWDEAYFLELYPQFIGKFTSEWLAQQWKLVETIVPNTDNSPIPYDPDKGVEVRKILMYAIMCHLCTLALSESVGTVTSASEGSVSVSVTIPTARGYLGSWLNSTPCGQLAWMLLLRYMQRGGRLYVNPQFHPYG